ncbi:MAG: hypothetical protein JST91_27750 [Actinobacteria bacterium]|nr:hypothetical protein [Actinomycetota bacterium]
MPKARQPSRSPSNWAAPAALVIAVLAVGLAAWTLVRSPSEPAAQSPAPGVTAQQPDDAKSSVCAAFTTVRAAVSLQTNADLGPDPVAKEAVAANARLATFGGGSYLLSRIDPATPAELASAVRTFANTLQDIGIKQLVGVPNTDPGLVTQLGEAQTASTQIEGLCT